MAIRARKIVEAAPRPSLRPVAPAPEAPVVRSYKVNLNPDPDLPVSLFDPKWNEPVVAQRVALKSWRELGPVPVLSALCGEDELESFRRLHKEERTFHLIDPVDEGGLRKKGGSYGELHKHFSWGGRRPNANFHAQAVAFAFGSDGTFIVSGRVGCWDGSFENQAHLQVRVFAGDDCVGAVSWTSTLKPKEDKDVRLFGKSDDVAKQFDAIDRVEVAFVAVPGDF